MLKKILLFAMAVPLIAATGCSRGEAQDGGTSAVDAPRLSNVEVPHGQANQPA